MKAERRHSSRGEATSRRLLLKRLATLGVVLFAPAILGGLGCATANDDSRGKNGFQTIDDVLKRKRPGEEKK